MNPIEKRRLIQDIELSLNVYYDFTETREILQYYGVRKVPKNITNRPEIKKLLLTAENQILLELGKHLKIDISNYTNEKINSVVNKKTASKQIFISHSFHDQSIALNFVELLESIGVSDEYIFCSSAPGYGTPLGIDFLDDIKKRFNEDILVFFILSENFYKSPLSLCEMGAAWVKTHTHIPVIIPPFSFEKMKGVFKHTQGITINNADDLNMLKETLEQKFDLKVKSFTKWVSKRDRIIQSIEKTLE